jgi:hypothetical protein
VCVYMYNTVNTNVHVSDYVMIVYELPLLANNTEPEIFLHKSGAVPSVD